MKKWIEILFICAFLVLGLYAFVAYQADMSTYQADLSDPWIQEVSFSPVETVLSAIQNQIEKDYTWDVQIGEVLVDENATERAKQMYIGSDLAKANGWSDAYLENNMIVVFAKYTVAYDHEKTFLPDGEIEEFFILLRDENTQKWKIWDTNGDPFFGR